MNTSLIVLLALVLGTTACGTLSSQAPTPTFASASATSPLVGHTPASLTPTMVTPPPMMPSATVTVLSTTRVWIGDAFFSGQAFVDANQNGQIDSSDKPLDHAMFIARDARGAEFGGYTNPEGHVTVSYPGGAVYPVKLRMKPPEGSTFVLIGPTEVVANDPSGGTAKFLFAGQPISTPSP